MPTAKPIVTISGLLLAMFAFSHAARAQMPLPQIWDVDFTANGKDLAIRGAFEPGAVVLINALAQSTRQLPTDPTILVVKEGVKRIRHLQSITFTIQDPDGAMSAPFVPGQIDTIVTLEDNGGTVNLKVGDKVLVLLGTSLNWEISSLTYDSTILGPGLPPESPPGTMIRGWIGFFQANQGWYGELISHR